MLDRECCIASPLVLGVCFSYLFDLDEMLVKSISDKPGVVDVIFHKQHSRGAVLPKFIQHVCSVFLAHTDFLQNRITNVQILSFLHVILAQGNMCCLLFHVLCSNI